MIFKIALFIGIYSYIIFSLGLLGLLFPWLIILATFFYWLTVILVLHKSLSFKKETINTLIDSISKKSRLVKLMLLLLFLQAFVNFVGALGPELGFDALWYHLTIPKIYLEQNQMSFINGGLLYYSGMPKLTEMIYLGFLANDIISKLIHFSFGILSLIAVYKLSRNFLDQSLSLLVAIIFYSNLVVGWQSITAYIDLARTFFELMALWGLVNWIKERKRIWFFESAVMIGLAISTKMLSLGSLVIFIIAIAYYLWKNIKLNTLVKRLLIYAGIALLVPSPYFIFNLINSGNPFYPLFSDFYRFSLNINFVNPLKLSDPISPVYLILLPFILFYFRKFKKIEKLISVFTALAFLIWYITPQTGGGRFIMPYLPAFSLVTVLAVRQVYKYKNLWNISLAIIILVSIISILYRGAANFKYIPVILGLQSRDQFLSNNLNFSYGDFYDTDGYFDSHLSDSDRVLLFGFHNLYYVNFPFIHSSYVKKGDRFNYIATQNYDIPDRFKFWNLVFSNQRTGVNLYSLGGQEWTY